MEYSKLTNEKKNDTQKYLVGCVMRKKNAAVIIRTPDL